MIMVSSRTWRFRAGMMPAACGSFPEVQGWNHRRASKRRKVCNTSFVVSPAGFEFDRVIGVQCQTCTADCGRKRRTSWKINRDKSNSGSFVTRITGGEIHVNPLRCGHLQDSIYANVLCWTAEPFNARPAVGNCVPQVVDNGKIDSFVE